MEKNNGTEEKAEPKKPAKGAHDPLKAFEEIIGGGAGEGRPGIEVREVVFAERKLKSGVAQVFTVVDGVECYSASSRVRFIAGKKYTCYVYKREQRKDGDKKLVGFVFPVSIAKLTTKEYLLVVSNILKGLRFRKAEPRREKRYGDHKPARFVATTENGKLAIVFNDYTPALDKPVDVMVRSEKLSIFEVLGEVPEEIKKPANTTEEKKALALALEAADLDIEAIDSFMIVHDDIYYDAVQKLNVDKDSSLKEVERAAKLLLAAHSPDAEAGRFRKLMEATGVTEPDQATRDEWESGFKLIHACREKMVTYVRRRDALKQYLPHGEEFSRSLKVETVAKKLNHPVEEVIAAARAMGWEVLGRTTVSTRLARLLSGYFKCQAAATTTITDDKSAASPAVANA